ncbi:Predicted arabinose efflux permease, MFS family [Palleronia marisminoris]|uniref:Putative MFS-type transporter YcaD n=1 Tax=Palleronia marisminoris TaxID=315423 RepID=A0A1Y5RHR1_9RHOB|nr:MFS transporter [Palleronia marisminoris]SFG20930.1 Predicted arabinose efflux permease, MFS family [Palleronia marisminoris]SLN17372.1 putative MFS-type transporter YcaD [Palleronia marisminoris]
MFAVIGSAWALFLGMGLLMIGNGMQGTLLGIRGDIEGFSTFEMSFVMAAYFAGFLGGSQLAPEMIRRVGHVRVFAALASFISAVLILYPSVTEPWAWIALRIIIGFSFSGVYVTAESWLNNATTAENRGQALSLYMIVQMGGIVTAQSLVAAGDPSGFILFVIPSVLVSLSFAPILLSISPTPPFDTTKPMSLRRLFHSSPLGCVGMILNGGMYSAQFGMASVYGAQAGLSVPEISTFIGAIFLGGLLFQYPVGWISDRIDRRVLILGCSVVGTIACLLGVILTPSFTVLTTVGFVAGGMINPLYSLLIAYTADYLDYEDMSAASGGLVFMNGLGAIAGPVIIGGLMTALGPSGFWLFLTVLLAALAGYAGYRMTCRAAPAVDETAPYVSFSPSGSSVGVIAGAEWAEAQQDEDAEES